MFTTEGSPLDAAGVRLERVSIPDTRLRRLRGSPDAELPTLQGAGARETEINFELRLPTTWNGKVYHTGEGIRLLDSWHARRLSRGYAPLRPTLVIGPAAQMARGLWVAPIARSTSARAVHMVTVSAKRIVEAAYGRRPAHSYFEGCSNGGRQAAMEAQRYPEDFDGIIAGAPPLDWSGIMMSFNRSQQALKAAPIPPEKLAVISKGVVSQCDAADGLVMASWTPREAALRSEETGVLWVRRSSVPDTAADSGVRTDLDGVAKCGRSAAFPGIPQARKTAAQAGSSGSRDLARSIRTAVIEPHCSSSFRINS